MPGDQFKGLSWEKLPGHLLEKFNFKNLEYLEHSLELLEGLGIMEGIDAPTPVRSVTERRKAAFGAARLIKKQAGKALKDLNAMRATLSDLYAALFAPSLSRSMLDTILEIPPLPFNSVEGPPILETLQPLFLRDDAVWKELESNLMALALLPIRTGKTGRQKDFLLQDSMRVCKAYLRTEGHAWTMRELDDSSVRKGGRLYYRATIAERFTVDALTVVRIPFTLHSIYSMWDEIR